MDTGQAVEIGDPKDLLLNRSSRFYRMVEKLHGDELDAVAANEAISSHIDSDNGNEEACDKYVSNFTALSSESKEVGKIEDEEISSQNSSKRFQQRLMISIV